MEKKEYKELKSDIETMLKTMSKYIYQKYSRQLPSNQLRVIILKIISNHILDKTSESLKAKVRPSTKVKKLIEKKIEENLFEEIMA